jgi:diguanylate cyclase (GGDEF)-like protein/PAS domain S-box-containing protein
LDSEKCYKYMINITKRVIYQALECAPQAIVIVDAREPGLSVAYANPAYEALTGLDSTELVGTALTGLVPDGDLPEIEKAATGEWITSDGQKLKQRWRVKSGQPIRVDVHLSALYENAGRPAYWMLTRIPEAGLSVPERSNSEAALRSALRDARRQLKHLERSDPATGISNHKVFGEALQRDWGIACREQINLGIIIFKIDVLAEYRALFGRHSTDSMLRKIGHAIVGSLRRSGDLGARLDNDRFAVLIGSADEKQASALAERIQSKVRKLAIHHPRSLARFVTVSFGVVSAVPERADSPEALMELAVQQLESSQDVREDLRKDIAAGG